MLLAGALPLSVLAQEEEGASDEAVEAPPAEEAVSSAGAGEEAGGKADDAVNFIEEMKERAPVVTEDEDSDEDWTDSFSKHVDGTIKV